ncbi:hypothetical protein BB560_006786, partial [Smittium megazygosporum]
IVAFALDEKVAVFGIEFNAIGFKFGSANSSDIFKENKKDDLLRTVGLME